MISRHSLGRLRIWGLFQPSDLFSIVECIIGISRSIIKKPDSRRQVVIVPIYAGKPCGEGNGVQRRRENSNADFIR